MITRRLVEAMGAQLQLDSQPGWGTRFSFNADLPVVSRPAETREAS
jgi:signal transduction histidine kinase